MGKLLPAREGDLVITAHGFVGFISRIREAPPGTYVRDAGLAGWWALGDQFVISPSWVIKTSGWVARRQEVISR